MHIKKQPLQAILLPWITIRGKEHTKLGVIRSCLGHWSKRTRVRKGSARWHGASSSLRKAIRRISIIALLIARSIIFRRGYWGRAQRIRMTALSGRATTAIMLDLPNLKLLQLLLQIGNVLPAIADVRIDPLLHKVIIGRLPHVGRSGDESLFPLDLAVDRGNELAPVHFIGDLAGKLEEWRRV